MNEASIVNIDMRGQGHTLLRVWSTDVDGYGNKLVGPILLAISINDGPAFVASRAQLVELFDEVLECAEKAIK